MKKLIFIFTLLASPILFSCGQKDSVEVKATDSVELVDTTFVDSLTVDTVVDSTVVK